MKTIKDIIDKFDEIDDYEFDTESQGLLTVRNTFKQFLQSSLTSLLDSIEKEATKMEIIDDDGEYYSTEYKNGFNDCLEKVINIINSHR